jgi:hypothetical protein
MIALVSLGVLLAAGCSYGGYFVYQRIDPESLTVENRTDEPVSIIIGTWYKLEVAPHSTGVLNTGWFPLGHNAFEVYSGGRFRMCDWSDVSGHLIVDENGPQCPDLGSNYPPLPGSDDP